jgi:hypothetical protein
MPSFTTLVRSIAFLTAAALLPACGTSALVSTRSGTKLEATIVSSDEDTLYTAAGSRIARSEVTDIDHPGNGAAITGLAFMAYGIPNILLAREEIARGNVSSDSQGVYWAGAVTPLVVGIGLSIWGYVVWSGSVDAAAGKRRQPSSLSLVPLVAPGRDGTSYGGVFTARF